MCKIYPNPYPLKIGGAATLHLARRFLCKAVAFLLVLLLSPLIILWGIAADIRDWLTRTEGS
jgi:hypothetical protein